MGKKAWLGAMLGRTGIAGACLRMRLQPAGRLLILAYHRITDVGDEKAFARDPELVSASVDDFERQMRYVRRHFDAMSFADVLELIDLGRPLPRRALIITFDDGHLDNYTHAFPVLRSLGLPATIFLSTDYVGTDRMFWFDRVAQLLYWAPGGQWQVGEERFSLPPDDVDARRVAAGSLLGSLKQVCDARRLEVLGALEALFAAHVPAHATPARSALDWSEVREMAGHGIEFGSHTCSHPILSRLDDGGLQRELSDSRDTIARHLGRPVHTVAYPVGKGAAFDQRVMEASSRCGYRLGISYETGINHHRWLEPFALRRLAVERYTRMDFFQGLLAFPRLLA